MSAASGVLAPSRETSRAPSGFWADASWRIRHDTTTVAAFAVLGTLIVLAVSADLLADHLFHWSF